MSRSVELSGRGKIWSFTKVYDAAAGYEEFAPYFLALVELEEGPMIMAQLTDWDREIPPEIGMDVEMVTKVIKREGDRGVIVYGYKFRSSEF